MTYNVEREYELRYESRSLTIVISVSRRGDSEEESRNVHILLEKFDKQIKDFFTQGI